MKNICERLLLIFNKIVFWSWNFIPNLLWKTYFMCLLLSDCTNTVVNRLTTSYILTKFFFAGYLNSARPKNWIEYPIFHFLFTLWIAKKLDFWKPFGIKSILIYEYQHKSTLVNTNQHESDTSQHESTWVWHESTRINTSQHGSDTSQQESKTSQHESNRSQHESPQVKKCPRWVNRLITSLTLV